MSTVIFGAGISMSAYEYCYIWVRNIQHMTTVILEASLLSPFLGAKIFMSASSECFFVCVHKCPVFAYNWNHTRLAAMHSNWYVIHCRNCGTAV